MYGYNKSQPSILSRIIEKKEGEGRWLQGPCCIKGPDPHLKSVSITLFTLLERSFEKKLIRRALKIITFAFYYFNEYVVVTLTVSNGSANICCECETFKVLLTSVQIGFGHNEWVGVTCCHCRLLKEIVLTVKHCYS